LYWLSWKWEDIMKKVKSNWIEEMLFDEYRQSKDVMMSLEQQIGEYPKGRLNIRKKVNKKYGRVYEYPYLSYSENRKVVNQHIPWSKFSEVKERIRLRDEIINQIVSYRERIQYLDKILKKSRNKEDLS
jgi:hypothetical protein